MIGGLRYNLNILVLGGLGTGLLRVEIRDGVKIRDGVMIGVGMRRGLAVWGIESVFIFILFSSSCGGVYRGAYPSRSSYMICKSNYLYSLTQICMVSTQCC